MCFTLSPLATCCHNAAHPRPHAQRANRGHVRGQGAAGRAVQGGGRDLEEVWRGVGGYSATGCHKGRNNPSSAIVELFRLLIPAPIYIASYILAPIHTYRLLPQSRPRGQGPREGSEAESQGRAQGPSPGREATVSRSVREGWRGGQRHSCRQTPFYFFICMGYVG